MGRSWAEMRSGIGQESWPKIQGRDLLFNTPYQKVYHIRAEFARFSKDYFVNQFGTRAGLVVDRRGSILLVRQYRLLIDSLSWEIPGGGVDDGESPTQAAVRECYEETGVSCANPVPLVFYHTGLDIVYSPAHVFYSTSVLEELKNKRGNSQEVNSWEWVPFGDCLEMILRQEIVDCFSVCALLAYQAVKFRRTTAVRGECKK